MSIMAVFDDIASAGLSGADFRALFDAAPFATLLLTPDLVVIDGNAAHARLTGVSAEALRSRHLFDAFPKNPDQGGPDTEAVIRASVARVLATRAPDEPPVQRHDLARPDNGFEPRYWRMIHSPVLRGGAVIAIRQDAWDVTEAVRTAERQQALQRIAGTISGIAFWEHDPETGIMVRTPELDAIFGFPPPDPAGDDGATVGTPGNITPFMARVHPDDAARLVEGTAEMLAAGPGAVRSLEYRITRTDGAERRVAVRGEVGRGADGRVVIVGTTLDVTDLHANEARLETLLAEKEVLLGEVNHRVKNSLQLVGAILALEARGAAPAERARLDSAVKRVQAVAAVHASLYHDDDVRTVEFGAHLRDVCARLAESLGAPERGIALVVAAAPVTLRAEVAVPLALIVNELVTNAFKYAFPEAVPAGARVDVSLRQRNHEVVLQVADNGGEGGTESGGGASSQQGSGLGSKLISILSRQIGATVTLERDAGWSTKIAFDNRGAPVAE